MKCTIPEISWHNRDPVLTVDIQPNKNNEFYRLASGGTDSHVLIWYMTLNESGSVNLELVTDLTRHQRSVNAVRWSPSGDLLASGDDESVIFIWKQKEDSEPINILENTNEQDKEIWITYKILRGHMEDVYDLSWSPNSLFLISGSVDNTAMVWDVNKGKYLGILNDHKGFVQGVAWDPKDQFLATMCTDRNFRIFNAKTRKLISRSSKSVLPFPNDSPLKGKVLQIFHDDMLPTFFRRLCFSPDGELIFAPTGVIESEANGKLVNTTYIYTRYSLKTPALMLPSPDQYTIAVRCCPLLFQLNKTNENIKAVIPLPYRIVFAVATRNSVYLYDTQQQMPFALISNIHYTRLCDITWSHDGRILVVASTDGFCSLITFAENELGIPYVNEENFNDSEKHIGVKEQVKSHPKINENKIYSTEKPTVIAIRRKPKVMNVEMSNGEISIDTSVKSNITVDVTKTPKKNEVVIISSEEKFVTPEKLDKPVTPIQVRRLPRCNLTPLAANLDSADNTSIKKLQPRKLVSPTLIPKSPRVASSSKASPIAVRRKPKEVKIIEQANIDTEEAVDAWPASLIASSLTVDKITEYEKSNEELMEVDCDEDIKLVYEDSQDEQQEHESVIKLNKDEKRADEETKLNTPKTPRRVPLITLSTPKSKKKL